MKTLKPPSFQFYVRDFIHGVQRFSLLEVGAYVLLLCEQWDQGGVPGDDSRELAAILHCNARKAAALWGSISRKFVRDQKSGLWRNARLEHERKKQLRFAKS